jgi:hypothetical protein
MNLDKEREAYKVVYKRSLRSEGWESGNGIPRKRRF